jgi:hypothetical protein
MTRASRLLIDPQTNLPSVQSFDQLGQFLKSSASDAESLSLTSSMGELSKCIEAVNTALATRQGGKTVGPMLVDLMNALRKHRNLVIGLGPTWRSLYEYAAYLAALSNFRVLLGQWLIERSFQSDQAVVIDDFEMIGWRTLGEGMLMIDVHEQARHAQHDAESEISGLEDSRIARAKNWWAKVRG